MLVVSPGGGEVRSEDELVDLMGNAGADRGCQALAAIDGLVDLGVDFEGFSVIGDNAANDAACLDIAHPAQVFPVVLFLAPGLPAAFHSQPETVAVQQVDGDAAEINAQHVPIGDGDQRHGAGLQLVRPLIFRGIGGADTERDFPVAGTAVAGIIETGLRIGHAVRFAHIGGENRRVDRLCHRQRRQAKRHGAQALLPFHCKNLFHDHIRCSTACLKTGESGFVEENATWAQLRRHYAALRCAGETVVAPAGFRKIRQKRFS